MNKNSRGSTARCAPGIAEIELELMNVRGGKGESPPFPSVFLVQNEETVTFAGRLGNCRVGVNRVESVIIEGDLR